MWLASGKRLFNYGSNHHAMIGKKSLLFRLGHGFNSNLLPISHYERVFDDAIRKPWPTVDLPEKILLMMFQLPRSQSIRGKNTLDEEVILGKRKCLWKRKCEQIRHAGWKFLFRNGQTTILRCHQTCRSLGNPRTKWRCSS